MSTKTASIVKGSAFVLVTSALVGFIYLMGEYSAGYLGRTHWIGFLIVIVCPLLLIWAILCFFFRLGEVRKWHVAYVIALTVLSYFAFKQPWNPRSIFVSRLMSIPVSATKAEVTELMWMYRYSNYSVTASIYVPEKLQGLGITHDMMFRWDLDPGNVDRGLVYFRDGKVVGVDFSPD